MSGKATRTVKIVAPVPAVFLIELNQNITNLFGISFCHPEKIIVLGAKSWKELGENRTRRILLNRDRIVV
jgi:hypothetical protein